MLQHELQLIKIMKSMQIFENSILKLDTHITKVK